MLSMLRAPSRFLIHALILASCIAATPLAAPEAMALAEPIAQPVAQPSALQYLKSLYERLVACDAKCLTDQWLFSSTLDSFITQMKAKWGQSKDQWEGVDWVKGSDGCSVPQEIVNIFKIDKDKPFGYDLLPSCYRHDFGYANYKAQSRFSETNRGKIDDNFRKDMKDTCSKKYGNNEKCTTVAELYWIAVRGCGGGACDLLIAALKALLG